MRIIIPGVPIPKARPRFARGRVYNIQKKEEDAFAWQVMKQLDPWPAGQCRPLICPVLMSYEFVMPIPKSTSKKRRKAMLSGEIRHVVTPDVSNLLKFAEDCLIGLLYADDKQIWSSREIKRYGENPRTIITVRET